MKEYLITLMTVAIICGIISTLSPKEDIGKYVSLICGICALGVMVAPVSEFLDGADGVDLMLQNGFVINSEEDYEKMFEESIVSTGVDQAEKTIKNNLCELFDSDTEAIDVELAVEKGKDSLKIKKVTVKEFPEGITVDVKRIIEYIEENLGCTCVIIYEDKGEV